MKPQPANSETPNMQIKENGEGNEIDVSKLTIHMVPFSHVSDVYLAEQQQPDFGEKKGPKGQGNNTVFTGSVSDILDSVTHELSSEDYHPDRSFTFQNLKFFKLWYEKQDEQKRAQVKKLIKQGKLDLLSGSWNYPDEALSQADTIIDGFMVG